MFKKVLALLLTLCMVLSVLPMSVFATEENNGITIINTSTTVATEAELKEAINNGGTVILGDNITVTEGLKIDAGATVVLDLNGKTLSQTKEQTAGYQMILNDGSLTIKDSVGGGKISYTDSGNGGEYISDTIYNRATLVINGGTIENLSSETVASNGYPHAVDTYSGIRDTSVTINGGTIYCEKYSAVRMFCVSATYKADLVINDGTIKGAVDMQNGTKVSANGTLTVNGGTFEKNASKGNIRFANWNGGATEYGITADIKGGNFDSGIVTTYVPAAANWNKKIVSGGIFGVDVSEFCKVGYTLTENENGTYTVGDRGTPNATVTVMDPVILEKDKYNIWDGSLSNGTNDRPLQIVMNFKAQDTLEDCLAGAFSEFLCDFYITIDGLAGDTIVADDCYLAGNYGSFGWIVIPTDGMELKNGVEYPVVSAYDATLNYKDICNSVKDFTAAIYISDAILEANPNFQVTLKLKMTNPDDKTDVITVGAPATYNVAALTAGNEYNKVKQEINANTQAGGTIDANTNATAISAAKEELKKLNSNLTDEELATLTPVLKVSLVDMDLTNGLPSKLSYDVTPTLSYGTSVVEMSELDADVTFKLPIPAAETKTQAKVYHEDELLGTYDIKTTGAEKYVEVSAKNFSTYTVEPVDGLSGTGTETDPFLINNISDLKLFRDKVNAGNTYAGEYVKLAADIDLGSEEWTPIGNSTNKFMGYFDGNNKTISNLKVTGNNRYVGLFGYIKGNGMSASTTPSVKDLTLTNVSVSGDYYVGGLSGQAYTCNITNVHVSGTVSGTRYVGGLVGHVYTYFKDCSFNGEATCSFDALGGIAGAGDCRAYDCSVIGTISGSNWVGGIVGNGQEGTSAVGCYVKATVSTSTNYYFGVGGIAGVAGHGYSSSEFKNNYFDGEVYLAGEKVDAIIMGIVNANDNASIGTTVEGNSWNTAYYPAETPVYV
ncbi:MAG: hypothetical protein E7623_05440, partial [Ruminococcaceae bacterium]|nr:hypothetical protein [Oscillospiraceae bacterium]